MTFLIQLPELTLLTDPVYSKRPGRWALLAPSATCPRVPFEQLPPVDLVLVRPQPLRSSRHPDIASPGAALRAGCCSTGLGNAAFLLEQGIARVIEHDWWQQILLRGVGGCPLHPHSIGPTVAGVGRNRTLWGGMWLQSAEHQIYFSGDSGYSPLFAWPRAPLRHSGHRSAADRLLRAAMVHVRTAP